MIVAGLLLSFGFTMLLWRPCRWHQGQTPRLAILLLAAAGLGVWVGSLGLAAAVAAGRTGDVWLACGIVWRQLVAGDLVWWRALPLVVWALVFPLRATATVVGRLRQAAAVRRSLAAVAAPIVPVRDRGVPVLAVPGLGTAAVTLGVVRPTILVDTEFWAAATAVERDVVLTHERRHATGRHAVVELLASWMLAPLRPLRAAADTYDCVRRHLEALADDAAARRHGREVVGTVVGTVALAAPPAAGFGMAGACLWRVQRLVAPQRRSTGRDRCVLVSVLLVMVVAIGMGAADAAAALGTTAHPDYCPVSYPT